MLQLLPPLLFLTSFYPLLKAWRANRRTALVHAVIWAFVAWAGWGGTFLLEEFGDAELTLLGRYVALCLTACAGVAVLGARRPGVGPWNYVLLGLLVVLLLPIAENAASGLPLHSGGQRLPFLGAALAAGCLNYLPTRLGLAAVVLALGSALEMWFLSDVDAVHARFPQAATISRLLLPAALWIGYALLIRKHPPRSELDQLWLDFRNRFGLFWGQRVRDQFNRSAANAGWAVVLRWGGSQVKGQAPAAAEMVEILRALLKRFSRSEPEA